MNQYASDLQNLTTKLAAAQEELEELQAELPNYNELVAVNEAEERELRENKASLSEIAQAKGRTSVARELRDQHLADIGTAQAEVQRLEARIDRTEKEATYERAKARKAELLQAWEDRAKAAGRTIASVLDDLYKLEREATQATQEAHAAARELGDNRQLAWPSFSLTPLLLSELPQAKHVGGGAITFDANRIYRVTLQPVVHPDSPRL